MFSINKNKELITQYERLPYANHLHFKYKDKKVKKSNLAVCNLYTIILIIADYGLISYNILFYTA